MVVHMMIQQHQANHKSQLGKSVPCLLCWVAIAVQYVLLYCALWLLVRAVDSSKEGSQGSRLQMAGAIQGLGV